MSDNMLIIVEGLHGDVAKLRAALATSQADVTRLATELAESVRALAVSQGEVAALRKAHAEMTDKLFAARGNRRAADAECAATMADMGRLRGDLERARGLLAEALELWGQPSGSVPKQELRARVVALLAPPTPTASPEPDRASPEVPKEPR